MDRIGGYVLVLTSERMNILLECIQQESPFTEPVESFCYKQDATLICFVVVDGNVTHLGLGRKSIRSGTRLRLLKMDEAQEILPPLPYDEIVRKAPGNLKRAIEDCRKGGLLTDNNFDFIVETIKTLRHETREILDWYLQHSHNCLADFSEKKQENLAFQKEAVMTALMIADLDRSPLRKWNARNASASFLGGLPSAYLREDQMIQNDMMKIPGFDLTSFNVTGKAVFASKGSSDHLTVIMANRLSLEEQTGTDLIYFNDKFKSFVMVQYKAMEYESERNQAIFRIPDPQLTEEIRRMDSLRNSFEGCRQEISLTSFRLSETPFFIKLCPRVVLDPDNIGLVKGMYIPLDYWRLLEVAPSSVGPRGGRCVTFENAKRYFDNTFFVYAVSKAWIGTTPEQSTKITAAIKGTIESGRAVAVAVKQSPDARLV